MKWKNCLVLENLLIHIVKEYWNSLWGKYSKQKRLILWKIRYIKMKRSKLVNKFLKWKINPWVQKIFVTLNENEVL
jgi:hypothetical protein